MGNGRLGHFSVDVNDPLFVVVEMSSPHGDRVSHCDKFCVCSMLPLYTLSTTILNRVVCSFAQEMVKVIVIK